MSCDDCGAEGATVHVLSEGVLCRSCHGFHVAWVIALGTMVTLAVVFIRGLLGGGV